MNRVETLANCPFCGGIDIRRYHNLRDGFEEVFCDDCGATVSEEKYEAATAAWNRRTPTGSGVAVALQWCVDVCDHAIEHYKGPVARKIRREIAVELKRRAALSPCRIGEETEEAIRTLTNCAQIIDVVKGEWEKAGAWSTWDQSVRDDVSKTLAALYALRASLSRKTAGEATKPAPSSDDRIAADRDSWRRVAERLESEKQAVLSAFAAYRAKEAFPPTSCNAWEDCNHDGLCHDPQGCGGIGPNSRI